MSQFESKNTYANTAFFRFRLSLFATERCCLRLAAASGLVANYWITIKRHAAWQILGIP
jgi:hypothetical protein